jgi:hypothetical protein
MPGCAAQRRVGVAGRAARARGGADARRARRSTAGENGERRPRVVTLPPTHLWRSFSRSSLRCTHSRWPVLFSICGRGGGQGGARARELGAPAPPPGHWPTTLAYPSARWANARKIPPQAGRPGPCGAAEARCGRWERVARARGAPKAERQSPAQGAAPGVAARAPEPAACSQAPRAPAWAAPWGCRSAGGTPGPA